jgi:ADP-heptose:LPS heptosyltransferase
MIFHPAHRILLCLRYGIGDVIMETPVIEALRTACPAAEIHALGARPAIELLEDDPRIDRLFCVQDWGLSHWGDAGTEEIGECLRRWVREQKFDLILDPSHAVLAVREAVRNSGTSILDACGAAGESALASRAGGIRAIKAAVRHDWGMEIPEKSPPRLHLRDEDFMFADRFLAGRSREKPLVSLSAAASSPLKRWPASRLAATADLLVELFDSEILFFSGPEEGAADPFLAATRHPDRIRPTANLHLKRVSALLSRSVLLICNDTGLMHMGAALGLPVVAVFGPTSPAVYFPGGAGSAALGGHLPCPHRKTASFGPPECLVRGECLQGLRSCIDAVCVDEMAEMVRSRVGEIGNKARGAEAQEKTPRGHARSDIPIPR